MKLGYARVSTGDQNLDGQCQRLSTAGCEKLFRKPKTRLNEPGYCCCKVYGDKLIVAFPAAPL